MSPSDSRQPVILTAHEVSLTIHELAAACRVDSAWVIERVRQGLIEVSVDGHNDNDSDNDSDNGRQGSADRNGEPDRWQFADVHLARVRCMVTMERDMDANPEVAALVADLVDEVRQLRARLGGRG